VYNVAMACTLAAAAVFTGCPQQPEFPGHPGPGLSEECQQQFQSAELRARLAVAALSAYGRIDPLLYVLDSQRGLAVSPSAVVVDETKLGEFSQALKLVLDDKAARQALLAGYEKAVAACGTDACPPKVYSFTVTPRRCNGTCFEWNVNGSELPNDGQWEDGYSNVYAHELIECPLIASLDVRSTNSGSAQTSSFQARGLRIRPCDRCDYNGHPGRYDHSLICALTC
jgi:hypothetical protein